MAAEFQALGVPRARRGALTDEALELIARCFASDEVEVNGQRFLFLPRPECPPLFVGGSGEHALRRAATLADGWFPGGIESEALAEPAARLRELAESAGRAPPEIVVLGRLPLDDPARAGERLVAYRDAGATRFALTHPYDTRQGFEQALDRYLHLR